MRPDRMLVAGVACVTLLGACGTPGDEPAPEAATPGIVVIDTPMPSAAASALDALFKDLYTEVIQKSYPGLWVGVWDPGLGTYQKAWGESVVGETAASTADVFLIGSITESLTATVMLQLVDEGSVMLDATVAQAAGSVANEHPEAADLTIRQLLGMSSGLPDYLDTKDGVLAEITADPQRIWSADELIDSAVESGVKKPGTRGYSTTNYLVLQRVAEEITGKAIQDLLAERITVPLGMSTSALPPNEDTTLPDPGTHGYLNQACTAQIKAGGGEARLNQDVSGWNTSYGQGGGGMRSTIADLGVWGASGVGNALLTDELAAQRLKTTKLPEGLDYGMGIVDYGDGFIGHSGEAIGWQAQVVHNPDTGMTMAMATNACSGADDALFDGIRTLVPFTLSQVPAESAGAPSRPASGTYSR